MIAKNFMFEAPNFQDAVVMPWYRNQDQPQVKFLFLSIMFFLNY